MHPKYKHQKYMNTRGVHGEKLVAALENEKLPPGDVPLLNTAIELYDKWIDDMNMIESSNREKLVSEMVTLLNNYKFAVDVDLIFDSSDDFLYRQKGQLKLDNTVMEEFLPILVKKYYAEELAGSDINVSSQAKTCSSIYFTSSIPDPCIGGGISCKSKDQDFSLSREIYIKASFNPQFDKRETALLHTNLGYVLTELKTNLDKTMFQEAFGTAQEIKQLIPAARYYLLCDFLDMTPISTSTTCIDEILVTRKCKRMSSKEREAFSSFAGRSAARDQYVDFLRSHPYCPDVFMRFLSHLQPLFSSSSPNESDTLIKGYF